MTVPEIISIVVQGLIYGVVGYFLSNFLMKRGYDKGYGVGWEEATSEATRPEKVQGILRELVEDHAVQVVIDNPNNLQGIVTSKGHRYGPDDDTYVVERGLDGSVVLGPFIPTRERINKAH